MGIRFACHHCGRRLNIKDELAGKRGVCPECKERFRIPMADAEYSDVLVEEASPPDEGPTASVSQSPSLDQAAEQKIALLEQDVDAPWYVRPETGGQFGPANANTLRDWILQGRVSKTSLVWREGWAQWREAQEAFTDAQDHLPEAPPQPSPRPDSPTPTPDSDASPFDSPELDADPAPLLFEGGSQIGTVRRQRNHQRMTSTGVLAGICLGLLAVLGYLIFR